MPLYNAHYVLSLRLHDPSPWTTTIYYLDQLGWSSISFFGWEFWSTNTLVLSLTLFARTAGTFLTVVDRCTHAVVVVPPSMCILDLSCIIPPNFSASSNSIAFVVGRRFTYFKAWSRAAVRSSGHRCPAGPETRGKNILLWVEST